MCYFVSIMCYDSYNVIVGSFLMFLFVILIIALERKSKCLSFIFFQLKACQGMNRDLISVFKWWMRRLVHIVLVCFIYGISFVFLCLNSRHIFVRIQYYQFRWCTSAGESIQEIFHFQTFLKLTICEYFQIKPIFQEIFKRWL